MSKRYEIYLTVREADEADFDKPLVRIHKTDKPIDIKWGDYIDISLDKRNWVTSIMGNLLQFVTKLRCLFGG